MAEHIRDLTPDPQNRRSHNPRNIGMLVDTLHAVGAARSIVIDEHGTIIAGNGVVEAAAEAGITKLQVIDADGATVIAVRRTGLSDEQKRQLAIADNRTAELATWNVEQLRDDAASGLDLAAFWQPHELAALIGEGVSPDWTGMPEFDQQDITAFRTIKIHFKSQADVDAFAERIGQQVHEKTKYLWFPPEERVREPEVFTGTEDGAAPAQDDATAAA